MHKLLVVILLFIAHPEFLVFVFLVFLIIILSFFPMRWKLSISMKILQVFLQIFGMELIHMWLILWIFQILKITFMNRLWDQLFPEVQFLEA